MPISPTRPTDVALSRRQLICFSRSGFGEVRRTTVLLTMLLISVCMLAVAKDADAALYKWTDERGIVHYSDQMPADAVNRANQQVNRQGMTVRKTEQAQVAPTGMYSAGALLRL